MFKATLTQPYRRAALTKGKVYEVIDANDYFGTYLVLDDKGERCTIDWMCFADQGHALSAWQRGL